MQRAYRALNRQPGCADWGWDDVVGFLTGEGCTDEEAARLAADMGRVQTGRSIMDIAVISITKDNTQMVGHGYHTFKDAEDSVRERVRMSKRPDALTAYRRFVIIGTVDAVDGMHVYDGNGKRVHEQFI
jgi:hypothetical protein